MTEFAWNIKKGVYIDAREVNDENDPVSEVPQTSRVVSDSDTTEEPL